MTKDSGGYDQAVCVRVEEVNGCFSQTDGSLLFSEGEQAAMPLHEAPAQVKNLLHFPPFGKMITQNRSIHSPAANQQCFYCIVPENASHCL